MNDDIQLILRNLANKLLCFFPEVYLRGEGASLFLYVVGNGRSAEVSWHDGGFWVEFWNSLNEDAQPVTEATFNSDQAVELALLEWMEDRDTHK